MTVALVHDIRPSTHVTGATAVRPAPHTPTPTLGRLIPASIILGAPSAIAIWGSATGLTVIAAEDKVASPWTLPACLDILALGVVIVAMMFPHVASRWAWRTAPWLCYAASLGLQVSDAWEHGPRAWGTHALALVAAAAGSHFILDLWEGRAHAPTAAPRADVDDEPSGATPELASAPVVALATPAKASTRTTSRRPTRKATAKASAEVDPDVLERVRKALADMGVAAHETNREDVLKHIRAKDGSAPHAQKVGPALQRLKEQDQ